MLFFAEPGTTQHRHYLCLKDPAQGNCYSGREKTHAHAHACVRACACVSQRTPRLSHILDILHTWHSRNIHTLKHNSSLCPFVSRPRVVVFVFISAFVLWLSILPFRRENSSFCVTMALLSRLSHSSEHVTPPFLIPPTHTPSLEITVVCCYGEAGLS